MATIKIPGSIQLNEINNDENDTEDKTISDVSSIEECIDIDVLDNEENVEIDFKEDFEPTEHADINIDDIAGNDYGYDFPIQRLEQEIILAEHDEKNQKFEESLRHRIRIIALSRIHYSNNNWELGKYETDLAHCYIDLFGPRFAIQCEEHAEESLKILLQHSVEILNEKEGAEYLQCLISTYYALARSQLILKKLEDSEKYIKKALLSLVKLEKYSIMTDEKIYPIKLKLNILAGKICLRLQKLLSASSYYNVALNMIQSTSGNESVDLIPIYQFLGKIEQNNGNLSNHSKAIEYYLHAHTLANKHYESHSEQVIQSARSLATAYSIIGTIDSEKSAESYLNECIQSLIINHGENHPLVCDISTDLARLFIRCDRKTEALSKLKSNLKKEKHIFGEYCEQILTTSQLIGSLQLTCGDFSEAQKYFKKALLIEELQNGPNSKLARNIKETLGTIKSNTPTSSGNLSNRPPFNATHRSK